MNCTIITHDDEGFTQRMQGSSHSAPVSTKAGFVFYSEALHIAQQGAQSRPWSRYFPEEETTLATLQGVTLEKPKTKAQLRAEALAAIATLN